jgi:Tfp pilus assembly protein PilF
MSLIIDALKKAQQLRLKGSEGSPILKFPHPDKKRRRSSKKQWLLIGVGILSLCIISLILLKPASPPSATQANLAMIPMEKKHPAAVPEKEEPLPLRQAPNRAGSVQAGTDELHYVGPALSGRPSSARLPEKIFQGPSRQAANLPMDQEPLPTGQAPNRVGSVRAGTEERPRIGAAFSGHLSQAEGEKKSPEIKPAAPSLPLTTQKEEAPYKSIGAGREGGKDPTLTSDVLTQFNSGVHFYNEKQFSKAIQAYQKAIELDPAYVEAYNNLGIIYQLMGDAEKAFWAYRKSTEINPRYEKGYNNLGILLLLKGHYDEALAAFEKALAINPNNIESHINLGVLFKKKGEWDKAIESYQKALAIDPLHRETHYNIALLYEQLENLELAISHYQQFIELSPKSNPELVSRVQRHLNILVGTKRSKK